MYRSQKPAAHQECACAPDCFPRLQVKKLLSTARDADALITVLPSLMEPRNLISVLVTVQKW
jgi:hypothetical protein